MVIFRVCLEMLGELVDAISEQCDLDLGRSGVAFMTRVLGDGFVLSHCKLLVVLLNRYRDAPR